MILDESGIRVAHALETLSILCRALFRKKFNNFAFDILSIICGLNQAKPFLTQLFGNVQSVLVIATRAFLPTDAADAAALLLLFSLLIAVLLLFSCFCSGQCAFEGVRAGFAARVCYGDGQSQSEHICGILDDR